jgi:mannose/fructose/N-acetylgalactosamine-specific phosphotransferase system component IIC
VASQKLFGQMVDSFKKLDKFSRAVLYRGLQLACGFMLMSIIFHLVANTSYGNYFAAMGFAKAAFDTSLTIATSAFGVALISDLAMKDRQKS